MDIMDKLAETGYWFLYISLELALLFVAVTFLVGLLREYVPQDKMQRVLGRGRAPWGNIAGAGFGAITPFCSCSTIPVVVGLLDARAPFGATMSFLIASPILNPIIIALMLALFGLKVTLIYALFAFTAAVLSGMAWEKFGFKSLVKKIRIVGAPANDPLVIAGELTWWGRNKPHLARAGGFAINLFRQLLPYLLLGAAIGAVIYSFIPQEFIARVAGPDNAAAIPVAAIIGVPMYIRASTIIPISAVLLSKGMSIGAVIALIIGGAGASVPEVMLLAAIFKKKLVAIFVATVLIVAIIAGFTFNALLA